MAAITINSFIDNYVQLRLFNSHFTHDLDLDTFADFKLQVFEPGITDPIIEIGPNDISTSAEHEGYYDNIVNVKIAKDYLRGLIPNPITSDRIREYRLTAKSKEDSTETLLEMDYIYIEANLTDR